MSLIEAKVLAVEAEQTSVEGTHTRPEWLLLAAILLEVRRVADALAQPEPEPAARAARAAMQALEEACSEPIEGLSPAELAECETRPRRGKRK